MGSGAARLTRWTVWAFVLALGVACRGESGVDAGTGDDAGLASDAGPADAGAADSGAAPEDAGTGEDAGEPAPDGGDAGVPSDAGTPADSGVTPDAGTTLRLPPANGGLDYQLGGAYPPPAGVTVVGRDRNDPPAAGIYNICYINGFQIQPDEVDEWTQARPELMLRDAQGDLVIDPDWDEILIDVRTPQKRAAVAAVVAGWIDGCRAAGFDAIEIDNLDTYSRSQGLLTEDDNVAAMRLFADAAHAAGMAIGQKNSAELVGRRTELGTDFAVVEECNRYDECDAFTGAYGDQVYIIEYRRQDFDTGCAQYPGLSIIFRDVNLTTPGSASYRYSGC
ncbi:MAG: endo alpha-1,4 polygalactosaminidase [Deltaproteobacteria bacterium]|nr:endo alpha-1,4 polygalactosaminidase [Deltaproteobacteria bacterium]